MIEASIAVGNAGPRTATQWIGKFGGVANPKTALTNLLDFEPVTVELATEAGQLFQKTGRRSRSLPDCIIAATALRDGASVATTNRDDFQPFLAHGLTLS